MNIRVASALIVIGFAASAFSQQNPADVILQSQRPSVRRYLSLHGLVDDHERSDLPSKPTAAGFAADTGKTAWHIALKIAIREINSLGNVPISATGRQLLLRDVRETIDVRIPNAIASWNSYRLRQTDELDSIILANRVDDNSLALWQRIGNRDCAATACLDAYHCEGIYQRIKLGADVSRIDLLDLAMAKRAAATVSMAALERHIELEILERNLAIRYSIRPDDLFSVSVLDVDHLYDRSDHAQPDILVPVSATETIALTRKEFAFAIGLIGNKPATQILASRQKRLADPSWKPRGYRVFDQITVELHDVTSHIQKRCEKSLPDCSVGHDHCLYQSTQSARGGRSRPILRSKPKAQPAELGKRIPSLYTVEDYIHRTGHPVAPTATFSNLFTGFDVFVLSPHVIQPAKGILEKLQQSLEDPLSANLEAIENYMNYADDSKPRLEELLRARSQLMSQAIPLVERLHKSKQVLVVPRTSPALFDLQELFSNELDDLIVDATGKVFERK
ncbi:MAG: hypothetical protein KDB23_07040 [Planctomycetales bacterium]|nr:hypothetical protein [Planctomycetales bacterium]